MPRKRNDACLNTCCLCFIFRLFHQRKESRDIWTSDLRPRLVFSGFPVYKGKFSIQTQPGSTARFSVATKPGHVNLLICPQGLCIITPFEFPILLVFSPAEAMLRYKRGGKKYNGVSSKETMNSFKTQDIVSGKKVGTMTRCWPWKASTQGFLGHTSCVFLILWRKCSYYLQHLGSMGSPTAIGLTGFSLEQGANHVGHGGVY